MARGELTDTQLAGWVMDLWCLLKDSRNDLPVLLIGDEGVEQSYPLTDQLWLIAVQLDYDVAAGRAEAWELQHAAGTAAEGGTP